MIVVDASVVVEILLRTDMATHLDKRLFSDPLIAAPHLIDIEVLHVLRRYYLTKELSDQRAKEAIKDFHDFPILRYPHETLIEEIWKIRKNLTAYDAAYVALSMQLEARLLTRDKKLASAAKRYAQVELV